MKTQLTQSELKRHLLYNKDTGVFTRAFANSPNVKVGDIAGSVSSTGYLHIKINAKLYRAHRLAWLYVLGAFPKDQIDHIDTDKTNNRIANLRECSNAENQRNIGKSSANTSGFKGVHWHKRIGKWAAKAQLNKKDVHLGYFQTPQDAASAYQLFAKESHGEFYKSSAGGVSCKASELREF